MKCPAVWGAFVFATFCGMATVGSAASPTVYATNFPGVLYDWPTGARRSVQVHAGYPFQYTYTALGATSFSVDGLPSGLAVNTANGTISGTPATAGTFPLMLKGTNADGTSSLAVTLVVNPTPNAPPQVTPVADIKSTYVGEQFGDVTFSKRGLYVEASQRPASYDASGLPREAVLDTTTGLLSWDENTVTPGVYHCTLTASNSFGTGSTTLTWRVHPAVVPLGITCDKLVYYTGDVMTFTVLFNAPVVVSGAPYLRLDAMRRAYYESGSGTSLLVFKYATTLVDGDIPGQYAPEQVELNGGAITSMEGLDAWLIAPSVRHVNPPYYHLYAPKIDNTSANGVVSIPFGLYQSSPDGAAVYRLVSGVLPGGLGLEPQTGDITGTPTAAGTSTFTLEARNPNGIVVTKPVTIVIASSGTPPPPPPPAKSDQTITFSSPVSAITVGQPVTLGALSSAGLPITYTVVSGDAILAGNFLTPRSTELLIIRAASSGNDQYNAASVDVHFGNPQKVAQSVTVTTPPGNVRAEVPLRLDGTSTSGLPVTYTVVSGPASIVDNTLVFTGTGSVTVRASQPGDDTHASADPVVLTFNAVPVNRLVNLSSRLFVASGDASQGGIAGFVVTGTTPKQILIRAVGPSLAAFGVATPLAEPHLRLFNSAGLEFAANNGWNDDAQITAAGDRVGAFRLANGSRDAALLVTLEPGAYTAHVHSTGSGNTLIEVYDVAANAAVPTRQLVNISTRATVRGGNDALIAGFVIAGEEPKRVLIRAIGPGLVPFGVPGLLADPELTLHDTAGSILARNDNWEASHASQSPPSATSAADVIAANAATGAFALQAGSKDAALVLTLNPGLYTAIVSGSGGLTGAALVEVYEIP